MKDRIKSLNSLRNGRRNINKFYIERERDKKK